MNLEFSKQDLTQNFFGNVYFLNGQRASLDQIKFIFEEEVVKVERCCCSLLGLFPSGLVSMFTWTLAGVTVRHEYCLVQTTNHKILIEITGGSSDRELCVLIDIRNLVDEKKLLKNKWYHRCLAKADNKKFENLKFDKVLEFVNAWIILRIDTDNGKYDVLDRNSKTLARSIYYFSMMDLDKTIDSIFENWVEEPIHLPRLVLNKISNSIAQWWDNPKRREALNIIGRIMYS